MSGGEESGVGAGIRVVVLGPPGSGKGTQAELASRHFGWVRISTGDLLREAIREGTPLGNRVRNLLEAGALVPDETIGEVVDRKLRSQDPEEGVLLDGFPRTRPQVEILDRILERTGTPLHAALFLDVEKSEILRRLGGRRVCRICGATFHVEFQPPRVADRCDVCEGDLAVRDDDRESVVRERLRVYESETAPVLECYRERGLLRTIPGSGSSEDVSRRFQEQLRQLGR